VSSGSCRKASKRRAEQPTFYERDIICLPLEYPETPGIFPFPRGKIRGNLGRQGLIGKICLSSAMTQEEIFSEIRSCFKEPFGGDAEFPFKVLQSAGAGSKSLILPSLSSNYEWKAKEVSSSGGTRAIYIWAQKPIGDVKGQVRVFLFVQNLLCGQYNLLTFL